MPSNPSKTVFKGTVHVLCGRGRTGKSTWARWSAERAILNGRELMIVDGDRTNSTLASFFPAARRPSHADDATVARFLEDITAELIATGGNALIDMGGGDRLFAALAEQKKFFTVLPRFGIDLIQWYFAAGGRDDFETLVRMTAMGLTSHRTAIVLNEGLAQTAPSGEDPFANLLSGRTLMQAVQDGARVVRMPSVPMATMAEADNLFIGIQAAMQGRVPLGDDGQPHPTAAPLGFWRRMELEDWLGTMEERHKIARVAEWLP